MDKGLLFLCSVKDIDKYLELYKFDILLHITRYTKKGVHVGFLHVPQLAPSQSLFSKTNNVWKKFKMSQDDAKYLRNIKSNDWFDLYKRDYLYQIKNDKEMQRYIARVMQRLDEGKNIMMVCYCEDYHRCHRSILGEYIREKGYNVFVK